MSPLQEKIDGYFIDLAKNRITHMLTSFFKNILDGFRLANPASYRIAAFLLFCTVGLGYFTEQSDTAQFFLLSVPFFGAFLFVNIWETKPQEIWFYVGVGILLRLALLPSFPLLSDDLYRFIWDGHLLREGISPFEYLPTYYAEAGFPVSGLNEALYLELNSPNYYTIYPPVAQLTFIAGVLISPESWWGAAIVMRLFLLFFEIGSIFLIVKLLEHFKYPAKNVYFYALNPLIIIEITGNLHFEGAMVFFLLLVFYILVKGGNYLLSAGAMSLAIASKLLPLLFLPFLIKRLGLLKSIVYFAVVGIITALLFAPVMGTFFIENFGSSLDLYFRKFEFNASIYYLARWGGYQYIGWNMISTIGPALAALTFFGIVIKMLFERKAEWKNLPHQMLFAICLYLLFTTTVHPWYVALPVVLCLFTRFRFPILWSGLIWLTYFNYSEEVYDEKLWAVTIEYVLLGLYAFWELFLMHGRKRMEY